MKTVKEIQKKLKESYNATNTSDTYSLLIEVGKRLNLNKQEREALKNDIANYLQHPYVNLRSAAIRVLGFYWAMPEYREQAMKMFQEEKNDQVRWVALMAWANTYRYTNNKKAMDILYKILKNTSLDEGIRAEAYSSIFVISPLQPKDWPKIDLNLYEEDFNKQINWELVENLVKNAVA